MKYIFVSGGVISGIGKGTTAASIAFLLKSQGYKIAPIKFENYLNLDAGTINPIEHGDPFLCEDGTEADMDIGTYEKFLDEDMGKSNFVTMGQIYQEVIDRERRFEYNGEDVEAIPYITDEITKRINNAGRIKKADIVIIELGGTAGEYQNVFYYEASRIMTLQNPGDVVHIHVSYVPTPPHLGEPKTKPTQLSVRTLNSMGIQPDFVITRSEKYLDQRRRERFALFCNMKPEDIISNPDLPSVYEIPLVLHKQGMEEKILKKLGLKSKKPDLSSWEKLVEKINAKKEKNIEIAIVGKYFGTGDYQLKDSYAALFDAIDHACFSLGVSVKTKWIDAEKVEKESPEIIGKPDGLIVPIGWGERGSEGMITAASYARKNKIPYLGLCYGMQLSVIAFARDMLGWSDANTTENDKNTKHPVIHLMPKQEEFMEKRAYGGTMRLGSWNAMVKKGTRTFEIYQKELTSERHRHRYEFNNEYAKDFEKAGMVISARSVEENLAEIIELPADQHPFYLGTQGHPEYKSRPLNPHPIFLAFIEAASKTE
ncbi:TPA: CTP synthase [Candidatus Daviesbacteria bacterium]|nr:MAG: CTP synthetase [Candidatus Daviesbacteria bacterium GW2011_GWA2_38_17]OGE26083.1 MAG: CTP synthase [Candidatus Daviesbacteria bacterium RIFCSPHIGHO2_02_FULL_39_41]OGE44856.1 MAG: CTP synthase [Candidatus Daviesbacteria bacterium RIFCSPHIGHO2_12_FULL_38_25]OGE68061.1 MAG: CTP synthase [Candidatus Daviesbacteria bacterium RIFCSPLOWO2_02_FULL_38_18]OGE71825.1 MAG: CTP synthase [Candidatus Daviesbacteria bacterium RIFCSPLOWO2_12_FULL_38_10]HBQ50714.1 CTP synthase [Candidatus Daviesbacteria